MSQGTALAIKPWFNWQFLEGVLSDSALEDRLEQGLPHRKGRVAAMTCRISTQFDRCET